MEQTNTGSSPRERGTHPRLPRHKIDTRFIPARAGNATPVKALSAASAVHPRASGERSSMKTLLSPLGGSSPRERGTLSSRLHRGGRQRFIPARAGNASTATARTRQPPVHPRASGERVGGGREPACRVGSSPRERGTRFAPVQEYVATRFIPARAGNARRFALRLFGLPVHPRASGERGPYHRRTGYRRGSSPRERGTRTKARALPSAFRFIPARAGNAKRAVIVLTWATVHPRASGERQCG